MRTKFELKRHEPRHIVGVTGRYRIGAGRARHVKLLDLSGHGCRFFDPYGRLEVGQQLTLRMGEIGPVPAEVRWCRDRFVGVCFEPPLHEAVLDHLRILHEPKRGSAAA